MIGDIIMAMAKENAHDTKRINHVLKMYGLAKCIAHKEDVDNDTLLTVEAAAVLHDIGIAHCEKAFGKCTAKMQEEYPDAVHPVVRTHPETGRKGLYVNASFTSHILDMEPEESKRILRVLYRQAVVPEYQCRFQWKKNSVAFWDNRAVQHYACFDYTPEVRRVERVTIKGDKPV